MKTKKNREKNFRLDLQKLLNNHDAELVITDDGVGYGMQTGSVVVTMNSIYDKETGDLLADFCEFEI
jgi:hypothetical protein